jgi:hypothetical protein
MRRLFLLFMVVSFLQGCDIFTKNDDHTPLIPKDTPFIVGILEATDDTLHHYPEVYVGYLSQPRGFEAEPVWKIPDIWWPVTNVQVTRPATVMDFKRIPDTEATVKIKGPIGKSKEHIVPFTHIGKGVYGDVDYELPLQSGEKYRLSVTMGDDREYVATTIIPEQFEWSVPDTAVMELELKRDASGTMYEEEKENLFLEFSVSPETEYITYQKNSEHDYPDYNTSEGQFLFGDRGDYLRFGAAYGVFGASDHPQRQSTVIKWFEYNDEAPLRMSEDWWLTMNQLNKPLSRYYYSVLPRIATPPSGRWEQQDKAKLKVRQEQDSSYLFDYMSNILKIGQNGEVLSKDKSDAFGVFGAYTADYRRLTVIPKRSWDPDTLNWGEQ